MVSTYAIGELLTAANITSNVSVLVVGEDATEIAGIVKPLVGDRLVVTLADPLPQPQLLRHRYKQTHVIEMRGHPAERVDEILPDNRSPSHIMRVSDPIKFDVIICNGFPPYVHKRSLPQTLRLWQRYMGSEGRIIIQIPGPVPEQNMRSWDRIIDWADLRLLEVNGLRWDMLCDDYELMWMCKRKKKIGELARRSNKALSRHTRVHSQLLSIQVARISRAIRARPHPEPAIVQAMGVAVDKMAEGIMHETSKVYLGIGR